MTRSLRIVSVLAVLVGVSVAFSPSTAEACNRCWHRSPRTYYGGGVVYSSSYYYPSYYSYAPYWWSPAPVIVSPYTAFVAARPVYFCPPSYVAYPVYDRWGYGYGAWTIGGASSQVRAVPYYGW